MIHTTSIVLAARWMSISLDLKAAVPCPAWIYGKRNQVERLWAKLKEWRAVATRHEKTASSFMGVLRLAAAWDWIERQQALI